MRFRHRETAATRLKIVEGEANLTEKSLGVIGDVLTQRHDLRLVVCQA